MSISVTTEMSSSYILVAQDSTHPEQTHDIKWTGSLPLMTLLNIYYVKSSLIPLFQHDDGMIAKIKSFPDTTMFFLQRAPKDVEEEQNTVFHVVEGKEAVTKVVTCKYVVYLYKTIDVVNCSEEYVNAKGEIMVAKFVQDCVPLEKICIRPDFSALENEMNFSLRYLNGVDAFDAYSRISEIDGKLKDDTYFPRLETDILPYEKDEVPLVHMFRFYLRFLKMRFGDFTKGNSPEIIVFVVTAVTN